MSAILVSVTKSKPVFPTTKTRVNNRNGKSQYDNTKTTNRLTTRNKLQKEVAWMNFGVSVSQTKEDNTTVELG